MPKYIVCCDLHADAIEYYEHLSAYHHFDAAVCWLLAAAAVAGIELYYTPTRGGVTIWGSQERLPGT